MERQTNKLDMNRVDVNVYLPLCNTIVRVLRVDYISRLAEIKSLIPYILWYRLNLVFMQAVILIMRLPPSSSLRRDRKLCLKP